MHCYGGYVCLGTFNLDKVGFIFLFRLQYVIWERIVHLMGASVPIPETVPVNVSTFLGKVNAPLVA